MTVQSLSREALETRLRDPGSCVLPTMLDRQAERIPDKVFAVFDDGSSWTYAEARELAIGTAHAFRKLGIQRGDRVLVWLPDGPEVIRISFGLFYLGAIFVPFNPELTGSVLNKLIDYADSNLLVADEELLPRLVGMKFDQLETVVRIGDKDPSLATDGFAFQVLKDSVLSPIPGPAPVLEPALMPWDVHSMFFTSGTTGISKGVESTHMHCATMAVDGLRFLKAEDRFVTPCAYFHVGGAYAPWGVIHKGASMAVIGRFRASVFWDQIRRLEATMALLIGVMCDFLLARPEQDNDRDNPLRMAIIQPLPKGLDRFMKRFDISVYTQFDQTETPPPMTSNLIEPNAAHGAGYCGQERSGFDCRIVDEHDCEVTDGQSGELVIRCDVPWVMAAGYFNRPEATAKAWRNGWFHTGDIFRRDEAGSFFFVDRSKDVIRRRGENISSFEIEAEAVTYESIAAAAAYGVPSEHGESEVMLAVEPTPGHSVDVAGAVEHLRARLPKHMVPRFLRVLDQLPRSASDKVRKPDLQAEGITPDTIDLDVNRVSNGTAVA